MFYACLTVLILFVIMLFCVTIAIIDLETYNFGLYIVLLCIVGTLLACAFCIANPNACANPTWYSKFCLMLQEMYPVTLPDRSSSPKTNGIRSRILTIQSQQSTTNEDGKLPLRQESRATVSMLAPAVHIMHQVWKGMAWVADGIEDEEATKSYENTEQELSTSETPSDSQTNKRLSTIAESTCSIAFEKEENSSEYTSSYDVII